MPLLRLSASDGGVNRTEIDHRRDNMDALTTAARPLTRLRFAIAAFARGAPGQLLVPRQGTTVDPSAPSRENQERNHSACVPSDVRLDRCVSYSDLRVRMLR